MDLNLSKMGVKWPQKGKRGEVWLDYLQAVLTRREGPSNVVHALAGRGSAKTYHMMLALFILMTDERYGYVGEEFTWYGPTGNRKDYNRTFLGTWEKMVPLELYKNNKVDREIKLINGSKLLYEGRLATNSNREPARGTGGRVIVLDEACEDPTSKAWKTIWGTLRGYTDKSRPYIILTGSTPVLGSWYQNVVERNTGVVIKATSYDNPIANDEQIDNYRAELTDEEVEQEIFANWVALSGLAWDNINLNDEWPDGNIHPHTWDPSMGFSVWCDIGVQSAWIIVQHVPVLDDHGWATGAVLDVAVGEYTPNHGDTDKIGTAIMNDYGVPSKVIMGSDATTRGVNINTTAETVLIRNLGWNCDIVPVRHPYNRKWTQYQASKRCLKTETEFRRFCISKELVTHEPNHRGLKELFTRDTWPERARSGEFLPKDKSTKGGEALEDIRDAWMYGCTMEHKPTGYSGQMAGAA